MGIPDPIRDPQFYAGVPMRRLVAFAIDFVVVLFLLFLVLFVGAIFAALTLGLGAIFGFLAFFATGFLYRWLLLAERSATLGMMVVGVEVRDDNGDRMNQTTAFLHTAGFYVTIMFPPLLVIGWMLMATSPTRQAMHDRVLGMVVINRPA